jgi:hypothetical protein
MMLAASPALAQHGSPYAGQEAREVMSLSEQELQDLEAGAGMGFAKPAELNGYPGPRHVLELAQALELDPAQRRRAQESFERMQARAIAAGRELVAAERALDALFADARADAPTLAAAVERAAAARGRLRLTHLEAHLEMRELLSVSQAETYGRLRGYHGGGHDPSRHHPPGSD